MIHIPQLSSHDSLLLDAIRMELDCLCKCALDRCIHYSDIIESPSFTSDWVTPFTGLQEAYNRARAVLEILSIPMSQIDGRFLHVSIATINAHLMAIRSMLDFCASQSISPLENSINGLHYRIGLIPRIACVAIYLRAGARLNLLPMVFDFVDHIMLPLFTWMKSNRHALLSTIANRAATAAALLEFYVMPGDPLRHLFCAACVAIDFDAGPGSQVEGSSIVPCKRVLIDARCSNVTPEFFHCIEMCPCGKGCQHSFLRVYIQDVDRFSFHGTSL